MISELSVRPKAQNKTASRVFYSLLLVGVAFLVVSYTVERYRGLISLGTLISVVAALFIYNRYMSGEYSYEVMFNSSDVPLFVIRKTVGSRTSTLCNLELAAVIAVDVVERGAQVAPPALTAEEMKAAKKYNFCPTLAAPRYGRITVNSRYEKAIVLIEGSDEFFDTLRAYAEEARALFMQDEQW